MGKKCHCPDCRFDRVGDVNCSAYDEMVDLGVAMLERYKRIIELEHRVETMYREILENGSWAGFCVDHPEAREWIDETTGKVK